VRLGAAGCAPRNGFAETVGAMDETDDFGAGINEAAVLFGMGEIEEGIIDFAFELREFREDHGLFDGLRVGRFANGLFGLEIGGIADQHAVDALLVEGEELEVSGLLDPSLTGGQGDVDFARGIAIFVELGIEALGEDGVLQGAGAL
jgi:hypothetical protein